MCGLWCALSLFPYFQIHKSINFLSAHLGFFFFFPKWLKRHNGRGYVRHRNSERHKRNQSYCHMLSVGPARHSFNSRASHSFNIFSFPSLFSERALSLFSGSHFTLFLIARASKRHQDLLRKPENSMHICLFWPGSPFPKATTLLLVIYGRG